MKKGVKLTEKRPKLNIDLFRKRKEILETFWRQKLLEHEIQIRSLEFICKQQGVNEERDGRSHFN